MRYFYSRRMPKQLPTPLVNRVVRCRNSMWHRRKAMKKTLLQNKANVLLVGIMLPTLGLPPQDKSRSSLVSQAKHQVWPQEPGGRLPTGPE